MSSPAPAPENRKPRPWLWMVLLTLLLLGPLLVGLIGLAGWDAFQEWRHNGPGFTELKVKIRQWLDSLGPLAPLGFILLQTLQVVIAPIPGEATGFLGGFLFGVGPGFLYSTVGLTLGSSLAFLASRWLGERVIPPGSRPASLRKIDALVEKNGTLVAFLLYLFPGAPKDYLSFLLGLTRMPFKVFVVLVTVGRMPATLMLTLQGAQVYQGNYRTFVFLLIISLVAGGLLITFRERLYLFLRRLRRRPPA